ncbi:MAG: hypothetical protein ACJAS1_005672 [Oleiphilaceae bacterium]|jgi:hypothetical protein
MISSKFQFDTLLEEVEFSFQTYINCPSEENEEHYLVMKNKYRQEVLDSDLHSIIEWSKE